jgi:outer membrane protein OmpA-like peptidoglycan-associated protein
MHAAIPIVLMGALVAILGDPPVERIVLLPDPDGRTGALTVTTARGQTLLEQPYAAADIAAGGSVQRLEDMEASVRQRFGPALEARPPLPASFTVYFVFDKEELTDASRAEFARIRDELARRPAPEVVVIGHTDRVGSLAYNDALALKRAERVRAALVEAGVDAGQIEVAGRGEREPAAPTADEVPEERNRRVEITVR